MNALKLFVAGVSRRYGISTRTNRDYDMSRLQVLNKMNSQNGANSTFQAAGFGLSEIEITKEAVPQFLALEGKYPLELDVTTDSELRGNNLVTVITGLAKQ